jgi:hypothetical protein
MSERDHYSNKGSHKARGEYWRDLRRQARLPTDEPLDDTVLYQILGQAILTNPNETTTMEYSHPNYETKRPQELE